jgi:hypothetical protein
VKRHIIQETRIIQYVDDEPKRRERPRRLTRRGIREQNRQSNRVEPQKNPRGFARPQPTEQPYYDGRTPHGDRHHDDDGGHLGEELL